MKFGYHNHDFEFSTVLNNKKLFDIILQNTDPELVAQQLDMATSTMAAPSLLPSSCNTREFELMHVKDEIKAASGRKSMKAPSSRGDRQYPPGDGPRQKIRRYVSFYHRAGILPGQRSADCCKRPGYYEEMGY